MDGEAKLAPGRVATRTVGGRSYRVIAARLVPERGVVLAALTPSSGIADEQGSVIGRLLVGLLGSLLLIAFVAYLAGRSIVSGLNPHRDCRGLDRGRASARARTRPGER